MPRSLAWATNFHLVVEDADVWIFNVPQLLVESFWDYDNNGLKLMPDTILPNHLRFVNDRSVVSTQKKSQRQSGRPSSWAPLFSTQKKGDKNNDSDDKEVHVG